MTVFVGPVDCPFRVFSTKEKQYPKTQCVFVGWVSPTKHCRIPQGFQLKCNKSQLCNKLLQFARSLKLEREINKPNLCLKGHWQLSSTNTNTFFIIFRQPLQISVLPSPETLSLLARLINVISSLLKPR